MIAIKQVYRCSVCGNIVEVLFAGGGELVCCGKPMILQEEKSEDVGSEKHVPIVTREGDKIKIRVGSVLHPMDPEHYIEWIECSNGESYSRKFLKPGDSPEAEFEMMGDNIGARAYCNIHGLWRS